MPVIDDAGRPQQPRSVGSHRRHEDHALEPGPRTCSRMREPGAAILVPKRAGIDEALGFHHPDRRFPAAAGILRPHHKDASVRVAAENIEPARVVADGRRPHAVGVLDRGAESVPVTVPFRTGIIGQCGSHQLPVHQVARVQDGQPGETVERGSRHIVILPDTADVRVAVIQMQDGIEILELGLRRTVDHQRQQQHQEQASCFHGYRVFTKIPIKCISLQHHVEETP